VSGLASVHGSGTERVLGVPEGERPVVDFSALKDAVCSTRMALRHVLHRRPKAAGIPLVRGGLLHEALASWVEGGEVETVVTAFKTSYRPLFEAAVEAGTIEADSVWHWKSSARILRHRLESWNEHPLPYVGVPGMVEVAVVKKDIVPGVDYVALLDWIVRSTTGAMWLLDWKTKKSLTPWFAEQERTSAQYVGQVACAADTGIEVSGCLSVGIEVGKLNSSDKKCKTHSMPYKDCALEHVTAPRIVPIQPTTRDVEGWEGTAKRLTKKLLRLKERVNSLEDVSGLPQEGRFHQACSFCDFREYCDLGRPANWVARMTVEETWNPLHEASKRASRKEARA
jgi:hypothetical protein